MRSRANAFSIFELLVGLGFVGIIAAVAVPSLMKTREELRGPTCAEESNTLEAAAMSYLAEDGATTGTLATAIPVESLRAGHYLAGEPACPSGAGYEVQVAEDGTVKAVHASAMAKGTAAQ